MGTMFNVIESPAQDDTYVPAVMPKLAKVCPVYVDELAPSESPDT
jgi:hypothetical protein